VITNPQPNCPLNCVNVCNNARAGASQMHRVAFTNERRASPVIGLITFKPLRYNSLIS